MPRTRYIKPSFFVDERVVELPFPTRLLFVGLWTISDRDGRLDDKPKQIKMSLFPADNLDVDVGLSELHESGLILRYVIASKRYIQIVNFSKHQYPHQNEKSSGIPAPEYSESNPSFNLELEPSTENGKAAATAASEDPVERRIWKDGIDLLSKSGMTEKQARPLLGRLAKDHGKIELAGAIATTQAENPVDPRPFLIGLLINRSGVPDKIKSQVGKSNGEAAKVHCKKCLDTGEITQKPRNAKYEWELESVPCPNCKPMEKAA